MKSRIRSVSLTLCMVAVATVVLTGCQTEEAAVAPVRDPVPSMALSPHPGIRGIQVHGQTLGPDHTIEFYEFEPGEVFIRESKSIDDGKPAFLDQTGTFKDLADLYVRLNPGIKLVPWKIQEVNRRIQANRSSLPKGPDIFTPRADGEAPLAKAGSGSSACSNDLYGDGWGGDWFINNYCTEGAFRKCEKNWGWSRSGWYERSWASWRQMEGDFNERGRIRCEGYKKHWYGDTLKKLLVDYQVLPRHVEIWYTTDASTTYQWYGDSPCGHLTFAFLRN